MPALTDTKPAAPIVAWAGVEEVAEAAPAVEPPVVVAATVEVAMVVAPDGAAEPAAAVVPLLAGYGATATELPVGAWIWPSVICETTATVEVVEAVLVTGIGATAVALDGTAMLTAELELAATGLTTAEDAGALLE